MCYQVIRALKFEKGKSVPAQYLEQFQQAELTFKHQLVFDPRSQQQVPLTPLPEGASQEDYDFAGMYPLLFIFVTSSCIRMWVCTVLYVVEEERV